MYKDVIYIDADSNESRYKAIRKYEKYEFILESKYEYTSCNNTIYHAVMKYVKSNNKDEGNKEDK